MSCVTSSVPDSFRFLKGPVYEAHGHLEYWLANLNRAS